MDSDSETTTRWGKTFQERFWWWRNQEAGVTLEQLQGTVNRHLDPDRQLAVSTLSNYEARGDSPEQRKRASEPRASFLAALGEAFPDLDVNWLVTGEGYPTRSHEEADRDPPVVAEAIFEKSKRIAYTGGSRAYGLFLEALRRVQGSLQDAGELSVEQQAELAGALADLVMAPMDRLSLPGGQQQGPSHDESVDYLVAMLNAVMQATPPRRKGHSFDKAIARLRGEGG